METTWVPHFKLDLRVANSRSFTQLVKDLADWGKTQEVDLSDIKSGFRTVTPELAERLLCSNIQNRVPRLSQVQKNAAAMTEGNWKRTGQTIIITDGGRMIDGQHRLLACYLSGASFDTYIVTDVEDEEPLFAYIDCGAGRTAKDALQTGGFNGVSASIAGAIKLDFSQFAIGNFKQVYVPQAMILDYAKENPDIVELAHSMLENNRMAVEIIGKKPVALYLGWLVRQEYGLTTVGEFMGLLADETLATDHPATMLRKKYADLDKEYAKLGFQTDHRIIFFVKAFNAWKTGQTLKNLRVTETVWPKIATVTSIAA